MNYPDTHNSVYLKYGDDPFGFKRRAVLFAYKGFRGHVGKMHGKFGSFFLINPNFCRHFIYFINKLCVF
jgi:hypothetical protein